MELKAIDVDFASWAYIRYFIQILTKKNIATGANKPNYFNLLRFNFQFETHPI